MPRYHADTLAAARLLIDRVQRPRGRLPAALVRRSISTAYYALFHFLLQESTDRIVGAEASLLKRRRATARAFSHVGMRLGLGRAQKAAIDAAFVGFFGATQSPTWARTMADTFPRAQELRHQADYDLNASLSESDAIVLLTDVETAIGQWQGARTSGDRSFKSALCLLMLLKGELRGR